MMVDDYFCSMRLARSKLGVKTLGDNVASSLRSRNALVNKPETPVATVGRPESARELARESKVECEGEGTSGRARDATPRRSVSPRVATLLFPRYFVTVKLIYQL